MLYNVLAVALSATSKHHEHVTLTANEAISGILGSVSLACWIFLLVPQLIENYRNQSAEAISLAFVIVWFLGDLANLLGAFWAGLVPVVIAIAVYFCISDGLLLSQILYYGIKNKRREGRTLLESVKTTVVEQETGSDRFPDRTRASMDSTNSLEREQSAQETEPLLSRRHSRGHSTFTIPGSHDPKAVREQIERRRDSAAADAGRPRRRSSTAAALSARQEPLAKIFEERSSNDGLSSDSSSTSRVLKNVFSTFGVVLIGALGWLIAYKTGTWQPTPPPSPIPPSSPDNSDANSYSAQGLGYLSAVLYLTARLPQIWKNYREQSCEGLSLLFFILSLMGNATYGGGILFHSTERNYVIKNVPWLIGSLGTLVEDGIVFWQFRLFRNNREEDVAIVDEEGGPSRSYGTDGQR